MTSDPFDAARALRWLRKLKKNNDRAWYAENSAEYNETIKPQWQDLVAGLLIALVPVDERFAYVDPRACLFRLARDIRFSTDKTPFKTSVSAWLSPFGKHGSNAGFYVRVSPGSCIFSAGIYVPERPVLDALRRRMASEPKPIDKILGAAKLKPYLPLNTDALQCIPRGYPKDHPRGELIRARNYLVRRVYTDAGIAKNGAFATFRAALKDCAPFVRYIDETAALSNAAMREPIDGWEENSSSDHLGPWSSAKF